jgi:ferredoxin
MLRTVTRVSVKSARNSLVRPATRSVSRAFLPLATAPSPLERQSLASRSFATVPITYIEPNGDEKEVQAEVGKHLLDIAHDNNIELEGACGGELACATCHLIFEQEMYDTLPEKDEEEDDMLDLAFELTDTSRLGCQICVRDDMAGMKVRIPDDGFN